MADSKAKVKDEDVELEDMEDEEEAGDAATQRRPLPGSLTAFQNHLEMMQVKPTGVLRLAVSDNWRENYFYHEFQTCAFKNLINS